MKVFVNFSAFVSMDFGRYNNVTERNILNSASYANKYCDFRIKERQRPLCFSRGTRISRSNLCKQNFPNRSVRISNSPVSYTVP